MSNIIREKKRVFYIAVVVMALGIGVGAFIDAYVTTTIIMPLHGDFEPWWPINGIVLLMVSGVAAFASLPVRKKYNNRDFYGAGLIFTSSLILVWCGFSDILSASLQGVFYGKDFFWAWNTWMWGADWWWMNWGSMPYLLSRIFGHLSTVFAFMVLGSIIGCGMLAVLWFLYFKKV